MSLSRPTSQKLTEFQSKEQQQIQYDTEFINPTLKQVYSPSQSQSISPLRGQTDISQNASLGFRKTKLEPLIQEIEQQSLCIKIKSQQIQELQARNSELELHYQMKLQELEAKQLYQIELAQSQLREKQQENSKQLHELNQLKNQFSKYQVLLEQTTAENNQLREQKSSSNDDQQIKQMKSQMQKQNDVIASLEEQNKYYEEEYNKYINQNQNLINQLKNSDAQIKEYQKELDIMTQQINQAQQQIKERQNDIERMRILHKQQLDTETQENQKLSQLLQQKQQEISNIQNQIQLKSQELMSTNQTSNQQYLKISELEQNNQDLQLLVDHQGTQITQLRKTINLLEKNLQNAADTETKYQGLLQTYNNLQEQLRQQQSEILQTANNNNLQQQLIISQQQSQQQQIKIEKLTIMLKNRLDEIELWKNKCYQIENQDSKGKLAQLIQENEILRQKYDIHILRCNVLEINIKENSSPYASQEIQQLNQIVIYSAKQILQQQEQIKYYEKQKKQLSSPKNQRYTPNEATVKDFNMKNKFH